MWQENVFCKDREKEKNKTIERMKETKLEREKGRE